MVHVYKRISDPLVYDSYRAINLLEHPITGLGECWKRGSDG